MHKRLSASLFIVMIASMLFCQENPLVLKGMVLDIDTKEALSGVNVYIQETMKGTTSNEEGFFDIKLTTLPCLIVFSRVGYTRRFFNLTRVPDGVFEVPLEKSIHEIPEVIVTAKRKPIGITEDLDLYVIDYDFYDEHILLLGHPGKRSRETHLLLMDRMGKQLMRKEVRGGVNLYRDPFNNLHLLAADTAYQIFFDDKDINLIYPTARKEFLEVFPEFLKVYKDKVILRQFGFEDQALMYYFFAPGDSTFQRFWAQCTPEIYKQVDGWMNRIRLTSSGKSNTNFNLFNADERFIKMAFYAPIFCPLEILNDTIYIFNFNNGLIETFGPEGFQTRSPTLMTFYIDDGWMKKIYADEIENKVYTQFMKRGITTLREINLAKGKLYDKEITIPDFPYIKKILVNDGFLFFLYEEKNFPKYQRLFRMEL